ncbi:alpha/beta fold hydrolase [Candidatus Bipolaricaulota bacterium]|nr:alpha/beta fold hydrolase [Candidatus Bipolaricaulota bacterium]
MELLKWIAIAIAVGGLLLVSTYSQSTPTAATREVRSIVAQDVTFSNGEVTLAGTLTVPSTAGPYPAVILISGSGPQNRDEEVPGIPGYRPFAIIAEHLANSGIAVLRYDDRGVGQSTGDHSLATSADFATDTEEALRYLLNREEIDPQQIGLMGHSEGGMIAAMVTARNPNVAFVISMAGTGVDGYNLLIKQLERIVKASGASEDEVAAAVEQQHSILALARTEKWEDLQTFLYAALLDQLQGLTEEQKAAMGDLEAVAHQRVAIQMEGFQSPWFQFFLAYDPGQDWEQITVPVLALFGGLDVQVDAEQNRVALEEALSRAGNNNITGAVFHTANHLFQDAVTGRVTEYATLPKEFIPGFLETITDWLLEQIGLLAQ